MQVLHVVNSITESSFALDFCTALAMHTHVEPVLLPLFSPPDLNHDPPFAILDVDYDTSLLARSRRLRSEARSHDLLHEHHNRSGALAEVLTLGTGVPTVTTQHNAHAGYHRLSRFINGITNPLADAVVCVSESVEASFFRWEKWLLSDESTHVIHNGAPIDRIESRVSEFDVREATGVDAETVLVGSASIDGRVVIRIVDSNSDLPRLQLS